MFVLAKVTEAQLYQTLGQVPTAMKWFAGDLVTLGQRIDSPNWIWAPARFRADQRAKCLPDLRVDWLAKKMTEIDSRIIFGGACE